MNNYKYKFKYLDSKLFGYAFGEMKNIQKSDCFIHIFDNIFD